MLRTVRRFAASPQALLLLVALLLLAGPFGCKSDSPPDAIVVNSLEDPETPDEGVVTLRSALASARSGQPIEFDAALDGGTIALSIIGEPRTVLVGEVMEFSDGLSHLIGYFERDYGPSALYARKDVVIDASALPSGITVEWTGGEASPARVLAVYGDLWLRGVTITGGLNIAEDISGDIDPGDPYPQPWSLARGGGLAVWGVADLADCAVHGNRIEGDFSGARDSGAFGGGVYANLVRMRRCVVSGNSVLGGGAAGGGVFTVGGAATSRSGSWVLQSSVTGNRIQGLFTYGGGVYSDGGGIGNSKPLTIENSTIARNVVEPAPATDLPNFLLGMGYWRGGGVYMSNGYLKIKASTIVENQTHGMLRIDSLDRPNLAGAVAATIGNAHAVEDLMLGHSIVAGNTVHEIVLEGEGENQIRVEDEVYEQDVFTGSLFYFRSLGYGRYGVLDFSQMLVPVGQPGWRSLSRRHYPQPDDEDGVVLGDVVDLATGITRSTTIVSVGVDDGELAVLHYEPIGSALDRVPADVYGLAEVLAEYDAPSREADDFLEIVLGRLEDEYDALDGFAADFKLDFETFLQEVDLDPDTDGLQPYLDPDGVPILTLADTHWFGPAQTWPRELENHPWIHFWHRLDTWLLDEEIPGMGPEAFGDEVWQTLFPSSGPLTENPAITMSIWESTSLQVLIEPEDQLLSARPANDLGDIGAIELP